MGTAPIGKLMLSMGLPVILSMMLQALYNIVDSGFVSNMADGENALNALTLAFPVQMLMVAASVGTGVGVNVLLAKSLGATVTGQLASFLIALFFHFKLNRSVDKGLKYIRPQADLVKGIYAVGIPAIIAQALMSFMTYGINIILVRASAALVTAYGLYYKIQQFILFAAFGLRDTITPIVSFNNGTRNKKRITDGVKYGVLYTLAIMLAGTAALELFAVPLCSVFRLSGTTEDLCVSAIRIISVSFAFAGVSIALQGVFQALEGGDSSLVISLCRQLLFVLPFAWLFTSLISPGLENAWVVWLTFPIAEIATSAAAIGLMFKIFRKKVALL